MHDPVAIIGWLAFPGRPQHPARQSRRIGDRRVDRVVGDGRPRRAGGPRVLASVAGGAGRRRRRFVRSGDLCGYGMVDVVFALIGVTILAIAVAAIAVTSSVPVPVSERFRARPLRAVLGCRVRGGRPRLGRSRPDRDGRPDRRGRRRRAAARVLPTPWRSPGKRRLRRPISFPRGGCRWRPLPRRTTRLPHWRPPARRLDRRGSVSSG